MNECLASPQAALPPLLRELTLPLLAAPMFLISGPELVIACCRSGIIGSFPALNPASSAELEQWLQRIAAALAQGPLPGSARVAPYALSLVVHPGNQRFAADLDIAVRHRVPLVIGSMGISTELVQAVHGYGGLVAHDVINTRHAEKALAAGVDMLIAVGVGAGGQGGTLNPFALLGELRELSDKPIVLSGAMSSGRHIAAARAAGASLAGMGTRFIATQESRATLAYKDMLLSSRAADVVYTSKISGVPANFLKASIAANGLDLREIAEPGEADIGQSLSHHRLAWKHVWSAGQGTGTIHDVPAVADLVARLRREYQQAIGELAQSLA
ncbi:nitronate monooxygenase [Solimonas aquatica]|uniref:Nitronate monooxygenase n=1 Tax=Solimonas aquatica TaxID=489703 RepID=A0A1H9GAT5_9GAMM|nr:nitronate monooxygenase [Solimonas aquatica]SEQ47194.1 nitronate monooxygenase [Solimonas aquatica]